MADQSVEHIPHGLSCGAPPGRAQAQSMTQPTTPPAALPADGPADLFNRQRRIARRAARRGDDFFGATMVDGLLDRLSLVRRDFVRILLIGERDSGLTTLLTARGMEVDVTEPMIGGTGRGAETDQLDVELGSYDLILWPGGLESINDVPGALLRARLALRPDGLLLGACLGDGSLPVLRAALRAGAVASGRPAAARMMPQLAVAALGDLMQRTGFALPVVDVDVLALRYQGISGLVRDCRCAAATALLAGPVPPLTRQEWAATAAAFAHTGGDDRTVETVRIIHFSGWAPDPSQPKPARRGSGTTSLAAALRQSGIASDS